MNKRVVVIGDVSYYEPFKQFGRLERDPSFILKSPKETRLIVFTGGEDVDPRLYGHTEDSTVYCNPRRDFYEQAIFRSALSRGIPMAGICRGAQFLCVMAGGKLVQDATGHVSYHRLNVMRDDGKVFTTETAVSSSHHQMQYPWDLPSSHFRLHAWTDTPRSTHYTYNGKKIGIDLAPEQFKKEPEVISYPHIGAIGFQYHPEYMGEESWGFKYTGYMTAKHLKEYE